MREMKNFDLSCFIKCAEEMLRADETASALWLLEKGIPGFYRENVPEPVRLLKDEIMARVASPSFYANHVGVEIDTLRETYKNMPHSLRGKILINDVRMCNEMGFVPTVVDLGPGEMWAPKMLLFENLKFSYKPIYVNHPTYEAHKSSIEPVLIDKIPLDRPTIYFACEILEHLWEPRDIRFEMNRTSRYADIIHMSTPLFTFDTECLDWRSKGDLGHLRTYTSKEFSDVVSDLFPEYGSIIYRSQIQHARGVRRDTPFQFILDTMGKDTLGQTLTRG